MPEKPADAGGRQPFLTHEGVVWKFPSQAREGAELPAKAHGSSRFEVHDPEDRRGKKRYRRHFSRMSCGQLVPEGYQTVWLLPDEAGPNDQPAPDDED